MSFLRMCVLVSIKDSYGMLSSCFYFIIYYYLNDYTIYSYFINILIFNFQYYYEETLFYLYSLNLQKWQNVCLLLNFERLKMLFQRQR